MKLTVLILKLILLLVLVDVAQAQAPVTEQVKSRKKRRPPVGAKPTESKSRRRTIEKVPVAEQSIPSKTPARVKEMRVAMSGCSIRGTGALRARLRALQNPGQLMSLEVWGDSKKYVPGQKVYFFFRSPRASYVTLFWVGPNASVVIPLRNVAIPANRDVRVDSGGIIVPPLGREEWVAINTLEPLHFPCLLGEAAVLRRLKALEQMPYGVGHWVVDSRP